MVFIPAMKFRLLKGEYSWVQTGKPPIEAYMHTGKIRTWFKSAANSRSSMNMFGLDGKMSIKVYNNMLKACQVASKYQEE